METLCYKGWQKAAASRGDKQAAGVKSSVNPLMVAAEVTVSFGQLKASANPAVATEGLTL